MTKISGKKVMRNALIIFLIIMSLLFSRQSSYTLKSIYFVVGALILYFFNYIRFKGDSLNPDGLFYLVWLTTIGLSQLNLSKNQSVWNEKMWGVILCSTIAYSIGSLFGELVPYKKKSSKTSKSSNSKSISKYDYKTLNKFLKYGYFISLTAFIVEVFDARAIPIFNRNFGNYTNFGMPYIHYLVISLGVILVLTYYSFVKFKNKDIFLRFLFYLGWLVLVSMLNRHVILFSIIGILIVRNYVVRRIKFRYISMFLGFSLIGFTIIGSLRNVTPEHLYMFGGFKKEMPMIFMWVYYYLTVGFTNLFNLLNEQINFGLGLQTFTPFWTFTGLKSIFNMTNHPSFTGVGTFLEGFYIDFGVMGVIFFPFILGVVSKLSYTKVRSEKHNFVSLTIYLCIVNELVFLFFTDYFSYTHIPLQIIVSVIFHFLSKSKTEV